MLNSEMRIVKLSEDSMDNVKAKVIKITNCKTLLLNLTNKKKIIYEIFLLYCSDLP